MKIKYVMYILAIGWGSYSIPSQLIKSGIQTIRTATAKSIHPLMRTQTQLLAQPLKASVEHNTYRLQKAIKAGCPEQMYTILQSTSRQQQLLNCRINNNIPLMSVIASENPDMARLFVARGAKVNVKDQFGKTPLHLAAYKGYALLVDILMKSKADIDAKDNQGETALHYAIKGQNTPSMQSNKMHTVAILLAHGSDKYSLNKKRQTPIDYNKQNKEIIADQIAELYKFNAK